MRIEFTAYADDCTIRGTVLLDGDRLTDLLTDAGDFDVEGANLQALEDGRVVEMPTATIHRSDLCAVTATGPRGNSQRRLRTRQRPMRAKVGPYTIVGYLHAPPSADPVVTALRKRIIPLTNASIEYETLGRRLEERHDAILLVREKVEWLEAASDEEVGLVRNLDLKRAVDAHAKDLTGAIVGNGW